MENNGKLLFVPNGGLGNRMRAIASAYWLMKTAGVSVRVVWIKDWTLGAPFASLFQPFSERGFEVSDASTAEKLIYDHPRKHNLWLPRLPQALMFGQRIDDYQVTPLKQHSFDFAAWAKGRRSYMSCYQEFGEQNGDYYRRLFRPTERVGQMLSEITAQFAPSTIGFHIRRTDHVEATANSPLSLFIDKAAETLADNPDTKIFLATDDMDTRRQLSAQFGSAIIFPPSTATSRDSVEGMQAALAEMLALAQTQTIYGCSGSTFPVVASRMSGCPLVVLEKKAARK